MKKEEFIFKICEIKTKKDMYPTNSANSQIKKSIALALRFGEKKGKEKVLKDVEKNIIKFMFKFDGANRLCDISPSLDAIFEHIKQRHLSTFSEKKKEHNSSFKK